MAKSRSFFGLRRGSTKSLTFSVLDGKQITKDRVYGGKNPRTQAQMVQRMVMATASAAYAHMKEIVDHSFEGVTYGAPTMARFVSENAKAIKAAYDAGAETFGYNAYQNRDLMIGSYIMSKGSATDVNVSTNDFRIVPGPGADAGTIQLLLGTTMETVTANALMQVAGLNVGEMATYCQLFPLKGSQNAFGFAYLRVKCLAAGDVALTAQNIGTYFAFESNYPVSIDTTAGIKVIVTIADWENISGGAGCTIHSVKQNGVWTRNNTSMVLLGNPDVQLSAEDGLATYPVGQSYILNGGEIE